MNTLQSFPIHPDKAAIWSSCVEDFLTRLRFRFYLPNVRRAKLGGVRLHIAGLSAMMKNVILTGRYESEERILCSKVLDSNDVVLELGSAIGFVGLFCRKVVGVKQVTGVEANPETLAMLRKNYALNGMVPNVIEAAAAAEDGVLELDVSGEFWENSIAGNSKNSVTVPALSLTSIIDRLDQAPTVLICDIEGAEKYLDFACLPDTVTKIVIELHPDVIGGGEVSRVVGEIEALGFTCLETKGGTALFLRQSKGER